MTTNSQLDPNIQQTLQRGVAIPAHPLALNSKRKLDERRQRALSRYYIDSGAGGIAIGVHTTQFEIRDPKVGLFKPVLELAAEEMHKADHNRDTPLIRVAGVAGYTKQAVNEAKIARELGYHAALVSLKALGDVSIDDLIEHCHQVGQVIPIIGFYLQTAVGGRVLPYEFWRKFAELDSVVAIKMAPFNRYYTLDVVRAVVDSGREDIALYTGNDDNIVADLITPYVIRKNKGSKKSKRSKDGGQDARPADVVRKRIVGGLLGHWAVWTRSAVELLEQCQEIVGGSEDVEDDGRGARPTRDARPTDARPTDILQRGVEVTDMNAAVFDASNNFKGVIAGVHEVLRRQGLLEGTWCLDENETLGPGQKEELDRVIKSYPHLIDDEFIKENLDKWMSN